MTKGKKKCEILKTIRCQVAKKNGIPYTYTECTYQGECRGTCPRCEEELRYLTRELDKLKRSGKQVAVAGVAAAVIATSAAGCSVDPLTDLKLPFGEEELAGAMVAPEELDGDVAYTPDPEDTVTVELQGDIAPPEEYVTAGEPAAMVPLIEDVIQALQQSEAFWMTFERDEVQTEWAEYLTESREGHDVFTCDDVQIIVIYDEYGWSNTATLYAETEVEES